MNNIFENAYFGKAYKTRDGRKAIYHKSEVHGRETWHYLIVEPIETIFRDEPFIFAPYDIYVNKNGLGYPENLKVYNLEDVNSPNYHNVIDSEWQEPIGKKSYLNGYYDALESVEKYTGISGLTSTLRKDLKKAMDK